MYDTQKSSSDFTQESRYYECKSCKFINDKSRSHKLILQNNLIYSSIIHAFIILNLVIDYATTKNPDFFNLLLFVSTDSMALISFNYILNYSNFVKYTKKIHAIEQVFDLLYKIIVAALTILGLANYVPVLLNINSKTYSIHFFQANEITRITYLSWLQPCILHLITLTDKFIRCDKKVKQLAKSQQNI
jgi:hypothetical protein